MAHDWIEKNSEAFERDVLRDFCLASESLHGQFHRFARTGSVSFSIMQSLVGEPLNKGLLWRLKDMAHHVFLSPWARGRAAPLLDWTLGYIFHESLKLMEDAHQRQFYAPRMEGLRCGESDPLLAELESELAVIQEQTMQSTRREVARLQRLLALSRRLFCAYFSGCVGHRHLGRFLYDNEELVRQTFGDDFENLMQAVYGGEPERMFLEAARSLLESGWFEAADKAIASALNRNPDMSEALELHDRMLRLRSGLVAEAF